MTLSNACGAYRTYKIEMLLADMMEKHHDHEQRFNAKLSHILGACTHMILSCGLSKFTL